MPFEKLSTDFLMPRANGARGKVRGALPRTPARGTPPETPAAFSFPPIFQNGPRRQGFAPPRPNRAPLTAPGRSEKLSQRRKRRLMQSPKLAPLARLPLVGPELYTKSEVEKLSQEITRSLTFTSELSGSSTIANTTSFQAHPVLEMKIDFRLILRLENASFPRLPPI
jgi:hypothetical protein